MSLIKPRVRRVRVFRHISRLQEPNREALLAYAKFIGESPDYVLNQLIETTLSKDRDFVTWRTEHGNVGSSQNDGISRDVALADNTTDKPQ
jgi:hypothetical protein